MVPFFPFQLGTSFFFPCLPPPFQRCKSFHFLVPFRCAGPASLILPPRVDSPTLPVGPRFLTRLIFFFGFCSLTATVPLFRWSFIPFLYAPSIAPVAGFVFVPLFPPGFAVPNLGVVRLLSWPWRFPIPPRPMFGGPFFPLPLLSGFSLFSPLPFPPFFPQFDFFCWCL